MPDTLLELVVERLDQVSDPVLLHGEAAAFPKAQLDSLLQDGILRACGAASEVPAPGRRGVVLTVRRTAKGLFGVSDDGYSKPVPLTDDDVRQYEISAVKLADRIRRDNRLRGAVRKIDAGLLSLGEKPLHDRRTADVYLALTNDDEAALLSTCRGLRPTPPRHAAVLVLRPVPISDGNRQLLASWGVAVINLDGHLRAGRWTLPWRQALIRVPALPVAGKSRTPAYCEIRTHRKTIKLRDRKAYESFVAKDAGRFQMFIDGIAGRAVRCAGGRKTVTSRLTDSEFSILFEYVEARKAMRPTSTKTCADSSPKAAIKLFEKARSKVDMSIGRYEFRAFKTHTNSTNPDMKAFEFAPPASLTYCLIALIPQ